DLVRPLHRRKLSLRPNRIRASALSYLRHLGNSLNRGRPKDMEVTRPRKRVTFIGDRDRDRVRDRRARDIHASLHGRRPDATIAARKDASTRAGSSNYAPTAGHPPRWHGRATAFPATTNRTEQTPPRSRFPAQTGLRRQHIRGRGAGTPHRDRNSARKSSPHSPA